MALFATIWTERTKNKTAKKNSFIEYQPFATYTSEHSRVLANKKKISPRNRKNYEHKLGRRKSVNISIII